MQVRTQLASLATRPRSIAYTPTPAAAHGQPRDPSTRPAGARADCSRAVSPSALRLACLPCAVVSTRLIRACEAQRAKAEAVCDGGGWVEPPPLHAACCMPERAQRSLQGSRCKCRCWLWAGAVWAVSRRRAREGYGSLRFAARHASSRAPRSHTSISLVHVSRACSRGLRAAPGSSSHAPPLFSPPLFSPPPPPIISAVHTGHAHGLVAHASTHVHARVHTHTHARTHIHTRAAHSHTSISLVHAHTHIHLVVFAHTSTHEHRGHRPHISTASPLSRRHRLTRVRVGG